jgi:hypothetical protein
LLRTLGPLGGRLANGYIPRDQAWAIVNHLIATEAPGIPYSWDNTFSVAPKNIKLVASYYGPPDLDFTSTRYAVTPRRDVSHGSIDRHGPDERFRSGG